MVEAQKDQTTAKITTETFLHIRCSMAIEKGNDAGPGVDDTRGGSTSGAVMGVGVGLGCIFDGAAYEIFRGRVGVGRRC